MVTELVICNYIPTIDGWQFRDLIGGEMLQFQRVIWIQIQKLSENIFFSSICFFISLINHLIEVL